MIEVLVADDDENVRESVATALEDEGHRVTRACDGGEAATFVGTREFDIAICDVRMPELDGLTLLRRIRRASPRTAVLLMTSVGHPEDAAESLREGAVDYILKPFDPVELAREVVGPIAAGRSLVRTFEAVRARSRIVAISPPMRALVARLAIVAESDVPLIVYGERGTGKELVARAIHARGARRNGPFVLTDCARLVQELRPSASGSPERPAAVGDAWLRVASGGTLVLDGVERLTLREQAHVARAITDEHVVARRGASGEPLGVRILALTRERLADRVADGSFQESLYYRLCGVQVRVPPLAEREDDLCHLVVELLSELQAPAHPPTLSPDAWRLLRQARWPGNVGQLRSALERALVESGGGRIEAEHLGACVEKT